jgi:hypothetical protein
LKKASSIEALPSGEKSLLQKEGKRNIQRTVEQYSLDVIISFGYRVKSKQGTDFRIWANKVLKAYLLKGYAINEKDFRKKRSNLNR